MPVIPFPSHFAYLVCRGAHDGSDLHRHVFAFFRVPLDHPFLHGEEDAICLHMEDTCMTYIQIIDRSRMPKYHIPVVN
jgi:hypothetical protein